jgi:hypothetical protein
LPAKSFRDGLLAVFGLVTAFKPLRVRLLSRLQLRWMPVLALFGCIAPAKRGFAAAIDITDLNGIAVVTVQGVFGPDDISAFKAKVGSTIAEGGIVDHANTN